jgi:hypothetical protein
MSEESVTASEWRELVFTKLTGLEAQLSKMLDQLTELRVNSISQKHMDAIEVKFEGVNTRLKALEDTKNKAIGVIIGIQAITAVVWIVLDRVLQKFN